MGEVALEVRMRRVRERWMLRRRRRWWSSLFLLSFFGISLRGASHWQHCLCVMDVSDSSGLLALRKRCGGIVMGVLDDDMCVKLSAACVDDDDMEDFTVFQNALFWLDKVFDGCSSSSLP